MKRMLFFGLLTIFASCDDGDLQIETLDFDSATIQNCKAVALDEANVFFKLNDSEALILELPVGPIKNEVSTAQIEIAVSESGPAKITYRTFSDKITKNYFCDEIPLTEPTVIDEIIAQGGTVFVTTTLKEDNKTFEHNIKLSGISLLTSSNVRITNLTIDNFGPVTTILEE